MPSDVIEAHVSRLPPLAEDDWTPRVIDRTELERALLAGGVAGTATHPIDNVRGNIQKLLDHDPDKEFGLRGLQEGMTLDRVLGLVERAAGAPIDRDARFGPVDIRARPVVDASLAAGERLARACETGETIVFATGHPTGLAYLYHELASELARRGATILVLGRGLRWRDPSLDHDWFIEHFDGVAMLSDGRAPRHTHKPDAMERMLAEERPDLVFADHGFAGAAIEAGVETISIADVNDTALLVAKAQGRTNHVLVFDDHVDPNAYWPVFLALTMEES
ncbi:MAG: glycosyltransferase family 4 protein [Actinomycetota bacterium]|nr:glycosyltransferase family 4 protein [Actinomycetota bacterium]